MPARSILPEAYGMFAAIVCRRSHRPGHHGDVSRRPSWRSTISASSPRCSGRTGSGAKDRRSKRTPSACTARSASATSTATRPSSTGCPAARPTSTVPGTGPGAGSPRIGEEVADDPEAVLALVERLEQRPGREGPPVRLPEPGEGPGAPAGRLRVLNRLRRAPGTGYDAGMGSRGAASMANEEHLAILKRGGGRERDVAAIRGRGRGGPGNLSIAWPGFVVHLKVGGAGAGGHMLDPS